MRPESTSIDRAVSRAATSNAGQIVADGYDRVAESYAAFVARSRNDPRHRYTAFLHDRLPPGARVLELGCGGGLPTTALLAGRFAVTGVDLSHRQIELARRQVPEATFLQGDMTKLDFAPEQFDAVVAFYSMIHVPRTEHRHLLGDIDRWLKPGGLLVATMGVSSSPDCVEEDWLGVPMYFSHFAARTNKRLVEQAGLSLVSARIEPTDEDGVAVSFLWVVAQKPVEPADRGLAGKSNDQVDAD